MYLSPVDRISFGQILLNTSEIFKPPRRIRVSEAAEKYVRISTPGGYSGPWSAEQTPYMVEPMDMLSSRKHEAIIFAGPARTGKTQGLVDAALGYIVTCDPGDTLVVNMTEDAARTFGRLRLSRLIRNSPDIKSRLSPVKHDDNILGKYFRDGTALILAWPTPTKLSAQDYKYVFLTDYDRMPDDIGEGDGFGLGLKRTQTFMSGGMCVVESSPGRDYTDTQWRPSTPHEAPPVGGTLGIYNLGDRRQWYWVCFDCDKEFRCAPGLDLFCMPKGKELMEVLREGDAMQLAKKYAVIACPHCGSIIEHRHKTELNANGRWVSDGQESQFASFWLGGVAAKFQNWESIVRKELQALQHYLKTGEEEKLKSTRNLDQGFPHIPMAAARRRSPSEYEARAESWTKGTVPDGVRFLLASIDVQGNRFVVQVHGIGAECEIWIVDRFNIRHSRRGESHPVDPAAYEEDWDLLVNAIIEKKYPLDDGSGRQMPIYMCSCDSGGKGGVDGESGVTGNAYKFWRRLKKKGLHKKFHLIKGDARYTGPRVRETYPDSSGKKDKKNISIGDVPILLLNTLLLKDDIDNSLKREFVGPNYIHFPKWIGPWFFEELSAETRTEKKWENLERKRNEAFDLLSYMRAVLIYKIGCDRPGWWINPRQFALPWDQNPTLTQAEIPEEIKNEAPKKQTTTRTPRMRIKR